MLIKIQLILQSQNVLPNKYSTKAVRFRLAKKKIYIAFTSFVLENENLRSSSLGDVMLDIFTKKKKVLDMPVDDRSTLKSYDIEETELTFKSDKQLAELKHDKNPSKSWRYKPKQRLKGESH